MDRPPKRFPIDSVELDYMVTEATGIFDRLTPDRDTVRLGRIITDSLTRAHVALLDAQGKTWDEQFDFIPKALLQVCRARGLDPVQVELVRRGKMPYGQITRQEETALLAVFS